jgi:hypothetical protein
VLLPRQGKLRECWYLCSFVYLRTIVLSRKISACFVFFLFPSFSVRDYTIPQTAPGTAVASAFISTQP